MIDLFVILLAGIILCACLIFLARGWGWAEDFVQPLFLHWGRAPWRVGAGLLIVSYISGHFISQLGSMLEDAIEGIRVRRWLIVRAPAVVAWPLAILRFVVRMGLPEDREERREKYDQFWAAVDEGVREPVLSRIKRKSIYII